MPADEDSIPAWQASLMRSESSSSSKWVKINQSPVTTPLPSLPNSPNKSKPEPLPIPRAPAYPASNGSTDSGSYEDRKQTIAGEEETPSSTEVEEEDPWAALKKQLAEAIEPLVEEGDAELDAHLFMTDMDKRLAEASW